MAYIYMLKHHIIHNVNTVFLPYKLPGISYITTVYRSAVLVYYFSFSDLIMCKTFSAII